MDTKTDFAELLFLSLSLQAAADRENFHVCACVCVCVCPYLARYPEVIVRKLMYLLN